MVTEEPRRPAGAPRCGELCGRDQALDPFADIGPPAPKPDSVLVTLKESSIFTVTMLPSDFCTCASYGEPAESVSTRMTVPPGTAASAAAFTLEAGRR